MCGPEDPLFTPLLQFAMQGLISSKRVSSQDPLLRNLAILALTASIFAHILALKPPNLEIFSSQAPKFGNFQFTSPPNLEIQFTSPPFQRQIAVRKPHTLEIRAAHQYLKKVECPPCNDTQSISYKLSLSMEVEINSRSER